MGSLSLTTHNMVLLLNPDNGGDNTVTITLTVDGESDEFIQPWLLWSED